MAYRCSCARNAVTRRYCKNKITSHLYWPGLDLEPPRLPRVSGNTNGLTQRRGWAPAASAGSTVTTGDGCRLSWCSSDGPSRRSSISVWNYDGTLIRSFRLLRS